MKKRKLGLAENVDEVDRARLRQGIQGKTVAIVRQRDDIYDGIHIEFTDGTVLEMYRMGGIGWIWDGRIVGPMGGKP